MEKVVLDLISRVEKVEEILKIEHFFDKDNISRIPKDQTQFHSEVSNSRYFIANFDVMAQAEKNNISNPQHSWYHSLGPF